jgi:hypothetical protein
MPRIAREASVLLPPLLPPLPPLRLLLLPPLRLLLLPPLRLLLLLLLSALTVGSRLFHASRLLLSAIGFG